MSSTGALLAALFLVVKKWCKFVPFFLISLTNLFAQAPLEVVLPRDTLKNRLVPLVLRASGADIQAQLQAKLDEINLGFTRQQTLEISLFDLIGDSEEDIQNFLKEFSSNPAEWNVLLDRLKFMKIRGMFNMQILPEGERFAVKFKPAEESRALAAFEGSLTAKPILQVLEVTDLQILETDQDTGEERRVDLSQELRLSLQNSFRFQMPTTQFTLAGQLTDNFSPPANQESPERPLLLELTNWQSTFKDVVLNPEDVEKILAGTFRGESFFELKRALSQTEAFRNILTQPNDPNRNLIERDVKAYLDQRTSDIVLWVERLPDGKFKPHISPADKPSTSERIEKARLENRLVLEATSTIPLRGQDLKIRYDDNAKMFVGEFVPEALFSPSFRLKTVHLPDDWMKDIKDPLVKEIAGLLYHRNLAEGREIDLSAVIRIAGGSAKLEVPVDWQNNSPHWDSENFRLSLDFLDQTEVESATLGWSANESVSFDFKSDESLPNQFFRQIKPILDAHEGVLGSSFFNEARDSIFRAVEQEILKFQGSVGATATTPGFNLSIRDFALAREGKLVCRYATPSSALSGRELMDVLMNIPQGAPVLAWSQLQKEGLLDIECEMELPRSIGIDLTNVKAPAGSVSAIKFDLRSPEDSEQPKVKMKWRLARDEETDVLMAIPLEVNLKDALAKYQIPTSGPGSPQIGYVQATGIKGAVANGVRGASMIWNYWLGPKTRAIQQTNEGLVMHLGATALSVAGSAFVRNEEVSTVDQMLREAVEKFKGNARSQITRLMFNELNGDLKGRLQIGAQRNAWRNPHIFEFGAERKPSRHIYYSSIDYMGMNYGLIGRAEEQLNLRLKQLQDAVPLGRPVGPAVIGGQKSLRASVEEDGRELVNQTLENHPEGVTEISSVLSNPKIQEQVQEIRSRAASYLTNVVSKRWKQIEEAVVNFIRSRSDPQSPAPQEALENYINGRLFQVADQETSLSGNFLELPRFCGLSVSKSQIDEAGELFYSVMPNIKHEGWRPPLRVPSRPVGSPRLSDLMATVGRDGAIPLGISTEFIEQIANNPQNLDRIERALETQARDSVDGISDKFTVDINNISIRLTAEGQPVIRASVKLDQPAEGLQNITSIIGLLPDLILSGITGEDITLARSLAGLPGWLGDRLTEKIQVIDGYMQFEIPFGVSVGDIVYSGGGHAGHYIAVWPVAEGFKVLRTEGWDSLVGSVAEDKLEENIQHFFHSTNINAPLSLPGFEDRATFKLGNEMIEEHIGRRTVVPLPTVRDADPDRAGLYTGSFNLSARLQIRDEAEGFPAFEAVRAP